MEPIYMSRKNDPENWDYDAQIVSRKNYSVLFQLDTPDTLLPVIETEGIKNLDDLFNSLEDSE